MEEHDEQATVSYDQFWYRSRRGSAHYRRAPGFRGGIGESRSLETHVYGNQRWPQSIGDNPVPGAGAAYPSITFTDFVSKWQFSNPADPFNYEYSPTLAGNQHVLRDIRLTPVGPRNGREDIFWPRLFLHTWDTNVLSGFSTWHGQEYGMFFQQFNAPTVGAGRRLQTPEDWSPLGRVTTLRGNNDGRPATIKMFITEGLGRADYFPFHMTFIDFAGNEWSTPPALDFLGRPWFRLSGGQHVLNDIRLEPIGARRGRKDIVFTRLYLHTWDTTFLSGYGIWNGQEYGMSFQRVSEA